MAQREVTVEIKPGPALEQMLERVATAAVRKALESRGPFVPAGQAEAQQYAREVIQLKRALDVLADDLDAVSRRNSYDEATIQALDNLAKRARDMAR